MCRNGLVEAMGDIGHVQRRTDYGRGRVDTGPLLVAKHNDLDGRAGVCAHRLGVRGGAEDGVRTYVVQQLLAPVRVERRDDVHTVTTKRGNQL